LSIFGVNLFVCFYETIRRELNKRLKHECRCDERRKAKAERPTRLGYTVLRGELEHLKIKTRLIDEKFASVMGECVQVNPSAEIFFFEKNSLFLFFFSDVLKSSHLRRLGFRTLWGYKLSL
jgi:hypothetical protein